MNRTLTLSFLGGAGMVTGSHFALSAPSGETVLIDCGLVQGAANAEALNRAPFPYDAAAPTALLVTHAHLDHLGRVPYLVAQGFHGAIYSTPATRDLAAVMFEDSVAIMAAEARHTGVPPLFTEGDARAALSLWRTVDYGEKTELSGGFSFAFRNAGHILGSAMAEVGWGGTNIVFTGDLGNSPSPLLPDTEQITEARYLVMESVYGDRTHEHRDEREERLEDVLEDAVVWGGTLLIPVFSIERTQTLLYALNDFIERGKIPSVPVFVDSPLAAKVTEVYRRHTGDLKPETQERIRGGDDIFKFPKLKFTTTSEESAAIERTPDPKIIIAGSGMSHGGRIPRHEARALPDPKSTLLIIGYQVPGSLGRQLQDGARRVTIDGMEVPVRARVVTLSGYSAHKDAEGLFALVEEAADSLKRVYVVMGEPRSSLFLAQRIRDYLGVDARVPAAGETVALEF